jgi:uracil phosphoribosyltransferase
VQTPPGPLRGNGGGWGRAPVGGADPAGRSGVVAGAQTVLPTARVAHLGLSRDEATGVAHCYLDTLPATIGAQVGVLVFDPMLATAGSLIQVLERLDQRGVGGDRLRVITALASSPGLQRLAERFPQLTVYTGCIDAELDGAFRIVPSLGDAGDRLFGSELAAFG